MENVKDWLDSVDIPFSEGPVNLSWPQIMKTINDNPKRFFEDGGWSFLMLDGGDDSGASETEESVFEMSEGSDAMDESSESDESDFSSAVSEDDSEASGSGSGEDEEGEDWDELEKKAARHDQKKRDREGGYDSDDGKKRRR